MDYIKYLLQTYTEADECTKGYPCRLTCIGRNKRCLNGLSEDIIEPLNKMTTLLNRVSFKGTEVDRELDNRGAGERVLSSLSGMSSKQKEAFSRMNTMLSNPNLPQGQRKALESALSNFLGVAIVPSTPEGFFGVKREDFEAFKDKSNGKNGKSRFELFANAIENSNQADGSTYLEAEGGVKDYIDNVVKAKDIDVTDEIVDIAYNLLPDQKFLNAAGLGANRRAYAGETNGEIQFNPKGSGNTDRGKKVLKRYLEQDGIDPYTGKFLFLKDAELDHISPLETTLDSEGNSIGDQPNNWAFVSAQLNRSLNKLTPQEWDSRITGLLSKGGEAYDKEWESKKSKSDLELDVKEGSILSVNKILAEGLSRQATADGVYTVLSTMKSFGAKPEKMIKKSGKGVPEPNNLLAGTEIDYGISKVRSNSDKVNNAKYDELYYAPNEEFAIGGKGSKTGFAQSEAIAMTLASMPNDDRRRKFIADLNSASTKYVKLSLDEQIAIRNTGKNITEEFVERLDKYSKAVHSLMEEYNNETTDKFILKNGSKSDFKGYMKELGGLNVSTTEIPPLPVSKDRRLTGDRIEVKLDSDNPAPVESVKSKPKSPKAPKRLSSKQIKEKLYDLIESDDIPVEELKLIRAFLGGARTPEAYALLRKYNILTK